MLTPGAPRDSPYWGRAVHIPAAAAIPAWLATTATVVSAASAVVGVGMSIMSGIQQGKAASMQAKAASQAGKMQQQLAARAASDARAQAQKVAAEERRKGSLVQSRAQAVAGASGAGATDPTVMDITSGIAGEGEYNALTALYSGESRAVAIENNAAAGGWEAQQQAASLRAQGRAAKTAGIVGGIGTALSKTSSWFADYGSQFFTPSGTDLAPGGTPMYGTSWTNYFE